MASKSSPELKLLLRLVDEAYEKKAWHGPNFRGSLRSLTARQAAWRPAPGRHNICELVLHAAYWKYAVHRRLVGGKRGSFSIKGSNWFSSPGTTTEKSWRESLALLDNCHRMFREAVAMMKPRDLNKSAAGSKTSNGVLIAGAAAHDLYHAGQIQLLKRLMK